ncbi:MAG: PhnA domain-containing protein [Flavobacteriales bacterium]|nr:PhnA domain-containing protein [Flavobacteriales bacterium]
MSLVNDLKNRANACELCGGNDQLSAYIVSPKTDELAENAVLVCNECNEQIQGNQPMNSARWRCLNDSIWSEHSAVKVLSYRLLQKIKDEGWPIDLLDMMYLTDEEMTWAKSGAEDGKVVHIDSNGAELATGDTVVLIKDLNVKGSSLVAKRGVAVRNIRLDPDNAEYIEGKVEGQNIVILTKYVKKS